MVRSLPYQSISLTRIVNEAADQRRYLAKALTLLIENEITTATSTSTDDA
jgi:hypothetical protein